jgi:HAD superfamily hydrolase (TIGR01484 family)
MIIKGLAVDYDGTLAEEGIVSYRTNEYLGKLKNSERKLVMVTGRELDELLTIYPKTDLFDMIVAENGALLYNPQIKEQKLLTPQPSDSLINMLKKKGVHRISVGKGIIATWRPWEDICLDSIQELGLELQVIFNKDAVMILPSGTNKATGLKAALELLKIDPAYFAAVGDAENDHSFLKMCGYSAAVSNAIPSLKKEVDLLLGKPRGEGVSELISKILNEEIN